ncbi:hypothetical protein GCM10010245_91540 [Streptomyces spectabilis]|nr:hypothetical protein GCM10010245_91540 [Streptomyces spectabilis]
MWVAVGFEEDPPCLGRGEGSLEVVGREVIARVGDGDDGPGSLIAAVSDFVGFGAEGLPA